MERRRWLGDLLAGPAGELLPHRLDHLPLARDDFQCLGDVLAELGQPAAADGHAQGAGIMTRSRGRWAGKGARTGRWRAKLFTATPAALSSAATAFSLVSASSSSSCNSN